MGSSSGAPGLLEAVGVTKVYPGVRAIDDVSVSLDRGEVLALVGENGAGKSTLMKILSGHVEPTEGAVRAAEGVRVALVHQELCLADNLTAGQNVCLGREPRRGGVLGALGLTDETALHDRAETALTKVGADFPARTPVSRLSIAQRQLVEIARALDSNADVIILDEPTSSLSRGESVRLLELLRELAEGGKAIVYVSHRLPEVLAVASRAVVLRDGRYVSELTGAELTKEALIEGMIGRSLGDTQTGSDADPRSSGPSAGSDDPSRILALGVLDLVTETWPDAVVNLRVSPGEIVGISGLVGSGRTELLESLVGLRSPRTGTVRLGEDDVSDQSPRARYDRGLGFIPEDRAAQGLFSGGRVDENLTLPSAHRRSGGSRGLQGHVIGGWLRRSAERAAYRSRAERLDVRAAAPSVAVDSLSGGNQQKILVGRWLADRLAVLILDEPTRGVDVGARESIYRVLEELSRQGTAILFASSDLEEVRRLSQRVLVMRDGSVVGELPRREATEQALMAMATGALQGEIQ